MSWYSSIDYWSLAASLARTVSEATENTFILYLLSNGKSAEQSTMGDKGNQVPLGQAKEIPGGTERLFN